MRSIQSKLLCQLILDLYIGKDLFDRQAKEDIGHKLASLLHKWICVDEVVGSRFIGLV